MSDIGASQSHIAYATVASAVFAQDGAGSITPGALGPTLISEFHTAEYERRDTEMRWLSDLRQYRGQYDAETIAEIGPVRSKAFVRKTRVKIKTVDSRVSDLLFPSGSEKNWDIDTTPVPTLSPQQKQEVLAALMQQNGGQQPSQEDFDEAMLDVAREASKKMSKVIEDQLVEARYKKVSLQAIHSAHLYGTGIIKGPLIERKVRTQFVHEHGKWVPKSYSYVSPFVDYVPLWRFYPDMSANTIDDCRYVYERHLMSKAELAKLAERKSFDGTKLKQYILSNPDGQLTTLYIDNELKIIGERIASQNTRSGQYEILERWGWLDGSQLADVGVEVPQDRMHESFFSNVWILPNGDVVKAVLQPINGVTWPYHLYYFDKDETSIFGEGLSAIMRDDQTMLNAAVRMALDNAAITAGGMIEVTPSLLSSMEKVDEMHPWKVWLRNATQPGAPAIRAIELPSKLDELFQLVQLFENNADEVTAIPRYMTGENATAGAAGTASGMSMLMGAANIVIKDLISAWDEGVTRPFLQALYRWNMQFHSDPSIKGDFDVKARGTASLVAKEVRAQALNNFAQLTANPLDEPYIKRDKLNRQRAEALEMSDVVKSEDEWKKEQESDQAKQQEQYQQQLQAAQLSELQGKAQSAMANAQLLQKKAEETMAKIELMVSQAVSTKVAAVYAAMQAGGVATSQPQIAPAGDEILRSSGWTDATPHPTIAQVNGPPVQPEMPVNTDPMAPAQAVAAVPQPAQPAQAPSAVAGADVGLHQGIETARTPG